MKQRTLGAWLRAYGLFAGGVIGVGVFALPAALMAAGVAPFALHLAVVVALVWAIHRWYLAVVLQTKGRHRLPGYARIHLGRSAYYLAAGANLCGLVGALVAYLIAGGAFLRLLLEPVFSVSPGVAAGLYLLPGALLLLWGLRALPALELVILALFLLVLVVLPIIAGDSVRLKALPLVGDAAGALLPYGILLFAFWGLSLVPETAELAGRSETRREPMAPVRVERRALAVLSAGLFTALASYVLFAVLVAGITGPQTTEDALVGLKAVLGDGVVRLALVFGILTTFSSYLALGLTLLRTLTVDLRVPRLPAWTMTVFVPVALVLVSAPSLLAVLGLTGAVFLGIEGLVVLAMRWVVGPAAGRNRAARGRRLRAALSAVGTLLVVGVASEFVRPLLF